MDIFYKFLKKENLIDDVMCNDLSNVKCDCCDKYYNANYYKYTHTKKRIHKKNKLYQNITIKSDNYFDNI